MTNQGASSGWHSAAGWIECTDRLPAMGTTVWTARWSTEHGEYQMVQDSLLEPALFMLDAVQEGQALYWMPLSEHEPAAPLLPDSLPAAMKAHYTSQPRRDIDADIHDVLTLVDTLQQQGRLPSA